MIRPRTTTMTLRCGLLGLAFAAAGAAGCSGGGNGGHAIYGKVTLDGAPLASGEIAFDPAGDGATVSTGGVITDGAYSIPAEGGPTPGKYRVSIRSAGGGEAAPPDEGPGGMSTTPKANKDPIPEKYNVESELTADVKPSGSTEANFALSTK